MVGRLGQEVNAESGQDMWCYALPLAERGATLLCSRAWTFPRVLVITSLRYLRSERALSFCAGSSLAGMHDRQENKGGNMPHFLHQIAYSREGWQAIVNNPQDRIEAVKPAIEK